MKTEQLALCHPYRSRHSRKFTKKQKKFPLCHCHSLPWASLEGEGGHLLLLPCIACWLSAILLSISCSISFLLLIRLSLFRASRRGKRVILCRYHVPQVGCPSSFSQYPAPVLYICYLDSNLVRLRYYWRGERVCLCCYIIQYHILVVRRPSPYTSASMYCLA